MALNIKMNMFSESPIDEEDARILSCLIICYIESISIPFWIENPVVYISELVPSRGSFKFTLKFDMKMKNNTMIQADGRYFSEIYAFFRNMNINYQRIAIDIRRSHAEESLLLTSYPNRNLAEDNGTFVQLYRKMLTTAEIYLFCRFHDVPNVICGQIHFKVTSWTRTNEIVVTWKCKPMKISKTLGQPSGCCTEYAGLPSGGYTTFSQVCFLTLSALQLAIAFYMKL